MFVFRVGHEILESFRLMLVILRLFNSTYLHACLDQFQLLLRESSRLTFRHYNDRVCRCSITYGFT